MKISQVKELLEELDIKPLKSLGQNFLVDEATIQKICSYKDFNNFNKIIEIGPGLGSLTNKFKDFKEKVFLVELDKTLSKYWISKGYNVYSIDALKFNWRGVGINEILISNLPYQISSRLLVELFCIGSPFKEMILMFQKEVGDRISAQPGDKKKYGFLSIICQLGWTVKAVTKVSNKCFYPSPEIESIVLSFSKKPLKGLKNKKDFVNHLKSLFGARRKKMKGVFKKYKVKWPKELKHYLEKRPDQINADEHFILYQFIEVNNV